MLKIKRDINQQDWKIIDLHFWMIFNHLKLRIASARDNFKLVKIRTLTTTVAFNHHLLLKVSEI